MTRNGHHHVDLRAGSLERMRRRVRIRRIHSQKRSKGFLHTHDRPPTTA